MTQSIRDGNRQHTEIRKSTGLGLSAGIVVGVVAYALASVGSTLWFNGADDAALFIGIAVSGLVAFSAVALAVRESLVGLFAAVTMLVLAVIAFMAGGHGAQATGASVLDVNRLFLHGGRSAVVAAVIWSMAAAAFFSRHKRDGKHDQLPTEG